MKKELQTILLGEGLGIIKFGMMREQVVALLGQPSEKEANSYSDDKEDNTETWHYDNEEVSLSFDEQEDWRLVTIAVTSPFYTIASLDLIGKPLNFVEDFITKQEVDDLELEDISTAENIKNVVLSSDEFQLDLWFEKGVLCELQWGVLYNDDDTVDWFV